MSFFFPQPAPASIEQVVDNVKQEAATEEPADLITEDLGVVDDENH